MEVVTLTQYIMISWQKQLLLIPINLRSAGVEILMPMGKCLYEALHVSE